MRVFGIKRTNQEICVDSGIFGVDCTMEKVRENNGQAGANSLSVPPDSSGAESETFMVNKAKIPEITIEMICAGEDVILCEVGGAELGGLFSAADLAERVYRAMCACEGRRERSRPRQ
jgi:hypothetical protein